MNAAPVVIEETPAWAIVRKPGGMPSAPLSEGEEGTLLSWFLRDRDECRSVIGRKPIEHGLVHRLDTGTEGLVLIAKTQSAYDSFIEDQNAGRIEKTYFAYCSALPGKDAPPAESLPLAIRSRFRAFGPGRREVRPLFPGMRGYDDAGKDYETILVNSDPLGDGIVGMTCVLTRGFRHQVRVHLAWLGFPIVGDSLYNPAWRGSGGDGTMQPLELHATGISFPDPLSFRRAVFSLPRPDRTIR